MSYFSPFTKMAVNVPNALAQAAKNRNIKPSDVDFDLLDFQTFYKTPKTTEWTLLLEPLESLFDEKMIRSEKLELRQEYDLQIRPYEADYNRFKGTIALASDKSKSRVVAMIKAGAFLPKSSDGIDIIKQEIYKKKLRANLMLGLFEKDLDASLDTFLRSFADKEVSEEDYKIEICAAPGPVAALNDKVLLHYKKHLQSDNKLLDPVDEGELIAEYIKPKKGRDGRNCSGKFVATTDPRNRYAHYLSAGEKVEKRDEGERIFYFAASNGYVINKRGTLSISNELSLKEASFKKTGSIDAGQEREVSVTIKHKEKSTDAVGSGVSIDVKALNVEGTIGAHTNVKAQELTVGEQTHRNAKLEALENAVIKLHRGNLKAKTATIEILETGRVIADDVSIGKMLGGEVIGHRVVINEMISNATVTALESIAITNIMAEGNRLIINPQGIESYHDTIDALKAEIKQLQQTLKSRKLEYSKSHTEHKERAVRIKKFQQKVLMATKAGKAPLKADVIRIKQYKLQAEKLQEQARRIATMQSDLENKERELHKLYEADLHASITLKGPYNGHTKIIFKDPKTKQEYTMTPKGHYRKIYLSRNENEKAITWEK